ncbi:MAG: DUF3048 domain-containing protein [Clostridiaceae bacterium]|nr:DUF3048 domain-containing protein [Clostridiaceae bacterium]
MNGPRLARILLPVLVALAMLVPAGCARPEPTITASPSPAPTTTQPTTTTTTTTPATPTPEPSPTPTATPAPTPTPQPPVGAINFMTGEPLPDPDAVRLRPMAFMVNNTKIATPQIGTGAADLIFETEIEGGVTRMLAIYTDVTQIPELGSLRSLRHDFIDIAGGLDAIIVHVGWSYAAKDQITRQNTDNINLQVYPSAWWRDEDWWQERGKEHSVKTTSERMAAALEKSGLRATLSDEQVPFAAFHSPDAPVPAQGDPARLVKIRFSGYNTTTLTWDEATGLYSKGEYGKPQLDLATGEPLRFSNGLILQTDIASFEGSILREIDLGSGPGYYVSGGRYEAITWKKGTTNDPFQFQTQSGEPLAMNAGKSYIAIVSDR